MHSTCSRYDFCSHHLVWGPTIQFEQGKNEWIGIPEQVSWPVSLVVASDNSDSPSKLLILRLWFAPELLENSGSDSLSTSSIVRLCFGVGTWMCPGADSLSTSSMLGLRLETGLWLCSGSDRPLTSSILQLWSETGLWVWSTSIGSKSNRLAPWKRWREEILGALRVIVERSTVSQARSDTSLDGFCIAVNKRGPCDSSRELDFDLYMKRAAVEVSSTGKFDWNWVSWGSLGSEEGIGDNGLDGTCVRVWQLGLQETSIWESTFMETGPSIAWCSVGWAPAEYMRSGPDCCNRGTVDTTTEFSVWDNTSPLSGILWERSERRLICPAEIHEKQWLTVRETKPRGLFGKYGIHVIRS